MSSTWVIENKVWINEDRIYKSNENGTSTLLVPYTSMMPFPVAIIFLIASLLIGTLLGAMVVDLNSFGSNAISPTPYTATQLSQHAIVDKTVATEIKLIVASKETIHSLDSSAFALAYSSKPCTIYIPTNMQIIVYPSMKKAEWVDQWEGNVIAHEIMHCIRGRWHS